jgi:proteasome accessory factor C
MHNQNKILRVFQLINLLKSDPPKSMKYVAEVLDSTERTLYRYFNLLEELGFDLRRDEHNRVYIHTDHVGADATFSRDQIFFLKKLLQSTGKNVKIKDSIISKLLVNSDVQIGTKLALQAHLGKIVDTISQGLDTKRRVILKKYHSFNSNTISDRAVEPIAFTVNYRSLIAFEIATKKNKIYNIDRITSVEVTRHPFRNGKHHRVDDMDVFGFTRGDKEFVIELHLSMRAAMLMKEEFPMTIDCIRPVEANGYYIFKATVYDLKPVARFILGLSQEINIIKGSELTDYLNLQMSSVFTHKVLDNRATKPATRIPKKSIRRGSK